jgi:putative transposase
MTAQLLLMLNAILRGIRFVILVLGGYHHVALENVALRQQLAVFKRDLKRPRLRRRDRLFWTGLMTIWKNWKSALVIVRPETVISWQRKRFKRYWWKLSRSKRPGRPRIRSEIRKLIGNMAAANPRGTSQTGWALKISERTVSRLMPKQRKEQSQTWKTFLTNHVGQLIFHRFLYCSHTAIESVVCIRCAGA